MSYHHDAIIDTYEKIVKSPPNEMMVLSNRDAKRLLNCIEIFLDNTETKLIVIRVVNGLSKIKFPFSHVIRNTEAHDVGWVRSQVDKYKNQSVSDNDAVCEAVIRNYMTYLNNEIGVEMLYNNILTCAKMFSALNDGCRAILASVEIDTEDSSRSTYEVIFPLNAQCADITKERDRL